jgi:sensor histidine kinase YesM
MKRTIVAFLVAPLLPALVPAWLLHEHNPDRTFVAGWIVLLVALYFLQVIVGMPAYFLARTKRRHVWFYLLVGSLGLAVMYAVASAFSPKINSGIAELILQISYFAVLGSSIGLVFWLIARPDKRAVKHAEISN